MASFVFARRLAQTVPLSLGRGFPPNAALPTADRHPMAHVDDYFDRSGRVPQPPYGRLCGDVASFAFEYPKAPDASEFKPGEGHELLVIPGFLTPDINTFPLRHFLASYRY